MFIQGNAFRPSVLIQTHAAYLMMAWAVNVQRVILETSVTKVLHDIR